MRTFVPDRTCWSLLLTALAIRLRYKPTYNKLRVLIINKDVRKSLARKNGNENPIWSWNDSSLKNKADSNHKYLSGSLVKCDANVKYLCKYEKNLHKYLKAPKNQNQMLYKMENNTGFLRKIHNIKIIIPMKYD